MNYSVDTHDSLLIDNEPYGSNKDLPELNDPKILARRKVSQHFDKIQVKNKWEALSQLTDEAPMSASRTHSKPGLETSRVVSN